MLLYSHKFNNSKVSIIKQESLKQESLFSNKKESLVTQLPIMPAHLLN